MSLLSGLFALSVCSQGSVLSVIAHADDDLYFINPAISDALNQGRCVQTVITTAGYFGKPDNRVRVAGLQAAYAQMVHAKNDWEETVVIMADKPVQRFILKNNPRVVLSFLNLPCAAHDQLTAQPSRSLHQLYTEEGETMTVTAVAPTRYRKSEWRDVYVAFINEMRPLSLYTLEPESSYPVRLTTAHGDGSHPDHVFVAKTARDAAVIYGKPLSIHYFLDYPLYEYPINLNAEQGARKHAAMQAYCRADITACNNVTPNTECRATDELPWGESWLCRQRMRVELLNAEPKKIME